MLMKVCNLNEITTALPGNTRRFTIDDINPIWVDLGKVMVARVIDGNLVVQSGDEMSVDHKAKFIELYWDVNLCVVTLFTDEVKNNLPLCPGEVTETEEVQWQEREVQGRWQGASIQREKSPTVQGQR